MILLQIWRKPIQWFLIFHTQTKKSQTAPKTELYAVHCMLQKWQRSKLQFRGGSASLNFREPGPRPI